MPYPLSYSVTQLLLSDVLYLAVPLLLIVLLIIAMIALFVVTLPLAIFQRYRSGTARRRGRGWVATVNFFGTLFSVMVFIVVAALTNVWIPHAFPYTLSGLAAGAVLGFVGLASSRWEVTPHSFHYTPNRWLILGITLVVMTRLGYGFWRAWNAWQTTPDATSWVSEAGAAGSMGAGAVVLGYYVVFFWGVRRRIRTYRRLTGATGGMRQV